MKVPMLCIKLIVTTQKNRSYIYDENEEIFIFVFHRNLQKTFPVLNEEYALFDSGIKYKLFMFSSFINEENTKISTFSFHK
jgi:hypothetical protein